MRKIREMAKGVEVESMMFCSLCGARLSNGSSSCATCRAPLRASFKGFLYMKRDNVGTRKEGIAYYLQTIKGDFQVSCKKRDRELYCGKMVKVTGGVDWHNRAISVENIWEIPDVFLLGNMGTMSLVFSIENSIMKKLADAQAISAETAVAPDEAELAVSERNWLSYFADDTTLRIRKTKDGRYYRQ